MAEQEAGTQDYNPEEQIAREKAILKQRKEGVLALAEDRMVCYNLLNNAYNIESISMQKAGGHYRGAPVCGLVMVIDQKCQYYEDQSGYGEKHHLVLTGHNDGSVLIWRVLEFVGLLFNYKVEVTAIHRCFDGIAIATADGFVHLWDSFLINCVKSIDLQK